MAHLGRRKAEHFGIGIRRRAGHVARMTEQIGRAPQQLHAGRGHFRLDLVDHRREVRDMLADRLRLRHDVDVVEAEIGQPEPCEELERFVELVVRSRLIDRTAVPGPVERAGAEYVEAVPAETVPVADRHAQLLLHRLAEHDAILVVIAIGQRIRRLRPFEGNRCDVAEI
jgi:hypothetical protein